MQTSSEVHIKLQINDFADEAEKSAMENGRHEEQGHLTGRLFFGQLAGVRKEEKRLRKRNSLDCLARAF